jgi:hypothetical protein
MNSILEEHRILKIHLKKVHKGRRAFTEICKGIKQSKRNTNKYKGNNSSNESVGSDDSKNTEEYEKSPSGSISIISY